LSRTKLACRAKEEEEEEEEEECMVKKTNNEAPNCAVFSGH
jgi:hypothetical protein